MISDHERFTEGDCHILAREINIRTGWPICTFIGAEDLPDLHAFIMRPDGALLDIDGLADEDTLQERWEYWSPILKFSSFEDLIKADVVWAGTAFGSRSYKRAEVVADRLLAMYPLD